MVIACTPWELSLHAPLTVRNLNQKCTSIFNQKSILSPDNLNCISFVFIFIFYSIFLAVCDCLYTGKPFLWSSYLCSCQLLFFYVKPPSHAMYKISNSSNFFVCWTINLLHSVRCAPTVQGFFLSNKEKLIKYSKRVLELSKILADF